MEFFLRDKESNEIISAENIIRGTKHEPFQFDDKSPYFATSLDNVLAEGNIPPATTSQEFIEYLTKLRSFINDSIPKKLETVAIPSARLEAKWLQTETAKNFGCDPSFNCWTGEVISPEPKGDNLRSAGFHIHVGYSGPTEEKNIQLAQAMDLFLGVPSVLKEPENERRIVGYGCAGNFRHQPHGMEYRVLSSYFASSNELMEWSFNNTHHAINAVNSGMIKDIQVRGQTIMECIDAGNKTLAEQLVKDFNITL